MRTRRLSRVVRGSLAATFATYAALLTHVSAGGGMPGPLGIVAPWLLSVLVCIAITGRRWALPRTAIAVGASQWLFHALFVLGASGTSPGHAAHAHHHVTLDALGAMPVTAIDLMWPAHIAAAVATIAFLRYGEHLLALVVSCATALSRRVRGIAVAIAALGMRPAARGLRPLRAHDAGMRPRRSHILGAVGLRGPPVRAAVV